MTTANRPVLLNEHLLHATMAEHGATLPAREFCAVVSQYFHEVEAGYYDQVHQEIFESETVAVWHDALSTIMPYLPQRSDVLDIGCGTGFAAQTVTAFLGPERINRLVCIDPSPDMLAVCKQKFLSLDCEKTFLPADISQLPEEMPKFDLIVSNSVLHHVFDLASFFAHLQARLKPGGVYICGHEPSARHYQIDELRRENRRFNRFKRLQRAFKVKRQVKRLLTAAGIRPADATIVDKVNKRLLVEGYCTSPLPANAISKMVDIHVPLSSGEFAWGEPGFDPEAIRREYFPGSRVVFSKTYHHLKVSSHLLGAYWQTVNARLQSSFPDGGADIVMAFRKEN